jgi:hypothetical protein
LNLENVILLGNSANAGIGYRQGGGVFNASSGTLNINSSTLSHNSGTVGGGIYNEGMLRMTNSIVSGNTIGLGSGAGIYNGGVLAVDHSTISGNVSRNEAFAGGIDNSGSLAITDSTISGNGSSYSAGGIRSGGTLTISNSTISGNTAGDEGGGLSLGGTVTISNSVLSNNFAEFGSALLVNGGNLTISNSIVSSFTVSGISPPGALWQSAPRASWPLSNICHLAVVQVDIDDVAKHFIQVRHHRFRLADTEHWHTKCGGIRPGETVPAPPTANPIWSNSGRNSRPECEIPTALRIQL